MSGQHIDVDYGHMAQAAAEKHLGELEECLSVESGGGEADWPETAGPYCGCETCIIREVLWAAWPYMRMAAQEVEVE